MQLIIDSATQSLQDVIRVVGALYNVSLEVGTGDGATRSVTTTARSPRGGRPARATRPARGASRATARRGGRRAGRPAGPAGETATIRRWALDNGYTVGTKGRIPAPVLEAYRKTSS